jgi:hypothetical protein
MLSTDLGPPAGSVFICPDVTICHIGTPLVNLTGCEIRFVLFGPDGRVTEWSLTPESSFVCCTLSSSSRAPGIQPFSSAVR